MVVRENAEELATIAREIGAQVIRGRVCYPGVDGGLDVGDVDMDAVLYQLRGQEVMLIVVPLSPAGPPPSLCELCDIEYYGEECPTCGAQREEAEGLFEEWLRRDREEKDRLIRDVEEWLEEQSGDPA